MRRRSTRRLFLLLLLSVISAAQTPPPPETSSEISALTAFRRALEDPLGALSEWDPSSPFAPCSWRGVLCSSGRVVEVRLPRLRLAGPFPTSLSGLPLLRRLSLRSNLLAGPLPSPLPPSLRSLSLSSNRLSGLIPSPLPPNLRSLDLASNLLTGPVPPDLPSSLYLLDLSSNRLTGTVPPSLGRLRFAFLDWNRIEGTLPSLLANASSLLHLSIQGNRLQGILPSAIAQIPSLQVLALARNRLSGSLPSSVFRIKILQLAYNNFSSLDSSDSTQIEVLDLAGNGITGPFPLWLANVSSSLTVLDLSGNSFSGPLPPEIGLLSAVQEFRVGRNSFLGPVPPEIGRCAGMRVLDLELNRFSGEIPTAIGGLTRLRELFIGRNQFSGKIPASLGMLSELETLSIGGNNLTGGIPDELLRMTNLSSLNAAGNNLTGFVPASIGNLSALQSLNLSGNGFSGRIPDDIGRLLNLRMLDLSGQLNNLSGELPAELFGLPNVQMVSLADNCFSGQVPEGFSSIWSLQHLNLTGNSFSGSIPATYGYLQSLQVLDLSFNNISGAVPVELSNCSNLTTFRLRSNLLSGTIPTDLSRLSNLAELDLGQNHLSGEIPPEISQCSSLVAIRLDGNRLSGSIPRTMSNLSKLQTLNLSTNNLTGTIPFGLATIAGLEYLNVSSNELQGEIPGVLGVRFDDPSVFAGNPNLCGVPLSIYCGNAKMKKKSKVRLMLWIGVASAGLVSAIALFCCCVGLCLWRKRIMDGRSGAKKRSPARGSGSSGGSETARPKLVMFDNKITYAETVEATRQFDEENVLSRSRHGLVFKACYNDGTVLSILRLASASADGAVVIEEVFFRKEAESLGKLKHRNLTVLRGYYAGPPPDVRLLVYDYMPNGNLATLLQEASHQDGHILNWPMRHLIALGVARGLAFLHGKDVIHGDVKPQSVLFDADFEAHVSDFGLEGMSASAAGASTSVGYVAADAGRGTREGDVYSFGIVLLELLTGRRPGMFDGEEEDIVKWVKGQLQRGCVADLLEPGLLELDPDSSEWEEFLLGVKVGLLCAAPDAADRPPMADVVFMLEGCRVAPASPA